MEDTIPTSAEYRGRFDDQIGRADAYQQETRTVETGLLKLALTVAAGTLAVSIGFVLGERRIDIPGDIVPVIAWAWSCLLAAMVTAIASWLTTSLGLTFTSWAITAAHGEGRFHVGKQRHWVDRLATGFAATSIVLCAAGLGLLGYTALCLLRNIGSAVAVAT
jgi:hypothetical protein